MNTYPRSRIILASFLFILMLSLGFSPLVQARSQASLYSLQNEGTIDNDLFLAEQQVIINQTVNGDVYVLDSGAGLVQVFDNNGIYQSQWGLDSSGGQYSGRSRIFVDNDIFIWHPDSTSIDRYTTTSVYLGEWQPVSAPANFFTRNFDCLIM